MKPNKHLIEAVFVPPTNTRGAKIKLTSLRFDKDRIIDGYPYSGDIRGPAYEILTTLGYSVVTQGDSKKGYIFAVKEFDRLKERLATYKAYKARAKKS